MKRNNKAFYRYICIMLFSIGDLVFSLNSYTQVENGTEIMIPLVDIIFITMGLIYLGISLMMTLNMWQYHIGKFFTVQLLLVGIALVVNHYIVDMTLLPINILFVASNFCLYGVIGRLTGLHQSRSYKVIMVMYILVSILQLTLNDIAFRSYQIKTNVLLGNHIFTFFLIIILLVINYKLVSVYCRKQIKILIKSLVMGMALYLFLSIVDTIELTFTENSTVFHIIETVVDGKSSNILLPVAVLSIGVFRILYILIGKEYFVSETAYWIRRIIRHIILIMTLNLLIALSFNGRIIFVYLINLFFAGALISNSYKILIRGTKQKELEGSEEDNYRLAMYLHDEILQDIFSIRNTVDVDSVAEEKLTVLVKKVRSLSNNLFPLIVENMGLDKSLQICINELKCTNDIMFDYTYNYPLGHLELPLETALYRMVKELINNAIKHAEASKITILISGDRNMIWTEVSDDGKGFEVPSFSELIVRKSMGLYSVYRQSGELGG